MKRTEIKRKTPLKAKTRLRPVSKRPARRNEIEMDAEWSAAVCAAGRCAVCGATKRSGELDPHHLVPRTFKKYRHVLANGYCVCRICHTKAHDDPVWFMEWLRVHDEERWKWLTTNRPRANQGLGPKERMNSRVKNVDVS